jgi:hypothetical protein
MDLIFVGKKAVDIILLLKKIKRDIIYINEIIEIIDLSSNYIFYVFNNLSNIFNEK